MFVVKMRQKKHFEENFSQCIEPIIREEQVEFTEPPTKFKRILIILHSLVKSKNLFKALELSIK